jgi:hypothetical protein
MRLKELIKSSGIPGENYVCVVWLTPISVSSSQDSSGNNPDSFQLPLDVDISFSGDKLIAQSQILDGVAVYERVTRKPFEINFSFTLRETQITSSTLGFHRDRFIFPMELSKEFHQKVWLKDEVLKVDNIWLNKLGILQVVLNDMQVGTKPGNTDIFIKMKCTEDTYSTSQTGKTLLI